MTDSVESTCILLIARSPRDAATIQANLSSDRSCRSTLIHVQTLQEGIQKLGQLCPAVILLDLKSTGLTTYTELANHAAHIPLIVLAGEKEMGVALQAVQAGAVEYLIKERLTTDLLSLCIRSVVERSRLKENLIENDTHLRILLDNGPDAIFIQINGLFVYVNQNAIRLFGAESGDELLGAPVIDRFGSKFHSDTQARIQLLDEGKQSAPFLEEVFLKMDGTPFFVEVGVVAIHWEGRDGGLVFFRNITRRVQVEQHLRLLSTALEAAANAIVITDHQGIISWVNPAFTTLSGYTAQEVIGKNPRLLKSGIQDEKYYAVLWDTIRSGKVWQNEIVNRRKDGSLYTEELTITPVQSEGGQITHFIAIKQDITGRKNVQAQLNEQVQELQRWFNITQGRESRILALKNEVNELLKKSGKLPRYPGAITDP